MTEPTNPLAFPKFPTALTEADTARLASLNQQKAELDNIYQQRFTPEAWQKLPTWQTAPIEGLHTLVSGEEAKFPFSTLKNILPTGLITPEQARERVQALDKEIFELNRKQIVTNRLPQIQADIVYNKLMGNPVNDPAYLTALATDLAKDFNADERTWITAFAQGVAITPIEQLFTGGGMFGTGKPIPLTEEDIKSWYSKNLPSINPEYIMSTVAFSQDLNEIATALQEAYPPNAGQPVKVDETLLNTLNEYYRQIAIDNGISPEGKTTEQLQAEIKQKVADEGTHVYLEQDNGDGTSSGTPSVILPDNSVWAENDVGRQKIATYNPDKSGTDEEFTLLTPEEQITETSQIPFTVVNQDGNDVNLIWKLEDNTIWEVSPSGLNQRHIADITEDGSLDFGWTTRLLEKAPDWVENSLQWAFKGLSYVNVPFKFMGEQTYNLFMSPKKTEQEQDAEDWYNQELDKLKEKYNITSSIMNSNDPRTKAYLADIQALAKGLEERGALDMSDQMTVASRMGEQYNFQQWWAQLLWESPGYVATSVLGLSAMSARTALVPFSVGGRGAAIAEGIAPRGLAATAPLATAARATLAPFAGVEWLTAKAMSPFFAGINKLSSTVSDKFVTQHFENSNLGKVFAKGTPEYKTAYQVYKTYVTKPPKGQPEGSNMTLAYSMLYRAMKNKSFYDGMMNFQNKGTAQAGSTTVTETMRSLSYVYDAPASTADIISNVIKNADDKGIPLTDITVSDIAKAVPQGTALEKTSTMVANLENLFYTREMIEQMTPEEAWQALLANQGFGYPAVNPRIGELETQVWDLKHQSNFILSNIATYQTRVAKFLEATKKSQKQIPGRTLIGGGFEVDTANNSLKAQQDEYERVSKELTLAQDELNLLKSKDASTSKLTSREPNPHEQVIINSVPEEYKSLIEPEITKYPEWTTQHYDKITAVARPEMNDSSPGEIRIFFTDKEGVPSQYAHEVAELHYMLDDGVETLFNAYVHGKIDYTMTKDYHEIYAQAFEEFVTGKKPDFSYYAEKPKLWRDTNPDYIELARDFIKGENKTYRLGLTEVPYAPYGNRAWGELTPAEREEVAIIAGYAYSTAKTMSNQSVAKLSEARKARLGQYVNMTEAKTVIKSEDLPIPPAQVNVTRLYKAEANEGEVTVKPANIPTDTLWARWWTDDLAIAKTWLKDIGTGKGHLVYNDVPIDTGEASRLSEHPKTKNYSLAKNPEHEFVIPVANLESKLPYTYEEAPVKRVVKKIPVETAQETIAQEPEPIKGKVAKVKETKTEPVVSQNPVPGELAMAYPEVGDTIIDTLGRTWTVTNTSDQAMVTGRSPYGVETRIGRRGIKEIIKGERSNFVTPQEPVVTGTPQGTPEPTVEAEAPEDTSPVGTALVPAGSGLVPPNPPSNMFPTDPDDPFYGFYNEVLFRAPTVDEAVLRGYDVAETYPEFERFLKMSSKGERAKKEYFTKAETEWMANTDYDTRHELAKAAKLPKPAAKARKAWSRLAMVDKNSLALYFIPAESVTPKPDLPIPKMSWGFPGEYTIELFNTDKILEFYEEASGGTVPLYQWYVHVTRLVSKGLGHRRDDKFAKMFYRNPLLRGAALSPEAQQHVSDYLQAMYAGTTLPVLTPSEDMLRATAQQILKNWEPMARIVKFITYYSGDIDRMMTRFPDVDQTTLPELQHAIDLYKQYKLSRTNWKNTETSLRPTAKIATDTAWLEFAGFMRDRTWGLIKNGFNPRIVVQRSLAHDILPLGAQRGRGRIEPRTNVEIPENVRDLIKALDIYDQQMTSLWYLREAWEDMSDMFNDLYPKLRSGDLLQTVLTKYRDAVEGYPGESYNFIYALFARARRTASAAVFNTMPYLPFRNLFQGAGYHTERAEYLAAQFGRQDYPEDWKMLYNIYYKNIVSEMTGLRKDWLYGYSRNIWDMPDLPAEFPTKVKQVLDKTWGVPARFLSKGTALLDDIGIYSLSDNLTRSASTKAYMNKAYRALQQYHQDHDMSKFVKNSGLLNIRNIERKEVLNLMLDPTMIDLIVPGLRRITGEQAALFNLSDIEDSYVNFLYSRDERGTLEQTVIGRVMLELQTFGRQYGQRVYIMFENLAEANRELGKGIPLKEVFQKYHTSWKNILALIAFGALVSTMLGWITGRRWRAPYSIIEAFNPQVGGFAIGQVQDLTEFIRLIGQAMSPDTSENKKDAAWSSLFSLITSAADTNIPFYNTIINAIDSSQDYASGRIDRQKLKELRAALDKNYTPEEMEKVEMTAFEHFQKAMFGGEPIQPDDFITQQTALNDIEAQLGKYDPYGKMVTFKEYGNAVEATRKSIGSDMLMGENQGWSPLEQYYMEWALEYEELQRTSTLGAKREEYRQKQGAEFDAWLLFWGKYDKPAQATAKEDLDVFKTLMVLFDEFGVMENPNMHSHFADWTRMGAEEWNRWVEENYIPSTQ